MRPSFDAILSAAYCPGVASALKLYVKVWCPWCIDAKRYLDKHKYLYKELNVERDAAAYQEMIRLSGQTYTPTLVVNDDVLADFGTDELEIFLKSHSITP